jgi:fibronectin-binding autotransporter adhesin
MATETWTGSTGAVSGNWSNASAWSGGIVPASGDTVLITQDLGQAYTVTLDANEGSYAALTVSFRNAILAFSDPGVTLTVAGPVTVSDGVISVTSAATLNANSISLTTGPVASGGLSIYAGAINTNTLTVNGGTILDAGGVLTAGLLGVTSGNVAVTADASTMNLGSLAVAGGVFGQSAGAVTVTGLDNITSGSEIFYGGAFTTGSLAVSGGSLGASGGTITSSGATTLSGSGSMAFYSDAATLRTGTLTVSGGTLAMSGGTIAVADLASFTGGNEVLYSGTLQASSLAFEGGSFGISGGHVTVTNQVSQTAGTVGFYGGTLNAGSLAISGGSLGMSGGTLAASGALTLSGTGSIGLYNTAATLQAGSFAQTGGSLGMSGGNLAITGQAAFTGGTDVFYAGSTVQAGSLQVGSNGGAAQTLTVNGAVVTVSDTASVAAGSTLSMYGGSFTTQGGITDSGTINGAGTVGGPIGGTGTLYAENGTLDLTGTIAGGLTFEIASYGDLKIDGTATSGKSLGLIDVNQVLEIGPSGSLTITAAETDTAGTTKLDGGTLTDAQGFYTGAYDVISGFGTINGTEYGLLYGRGAAIHAAGGTLTLNGDIYAGNKPDIAAGATFSLLGAVQGNLPPFYSSAVQFNFLSSDSGALRLGTATARESFEANGIIGNMNVSTTGVPTNVLDLGDVQPGSITSAIVANGNTIELFNGSTMTDHFSLASSVGTPAVHWASDGGSGANIFLSV